MIDLPINKIMNGDALMHLKELPSNSVDCVMTSPPYWSLRDYGVEGQLGLEPTFQEYINKLCDIFDEVKRVLKKSGTCWVNLGDSYNNSNWDGDKPNKFDHDPKDKEGGLAGRGGQKGYSDKCLCMIPERFAIEMVNRGWILRNKIIWYKRNSMPSSVKDRFANKWEHIFLFVKSKKYYFDLDSVRKKYEQSSIARIKAGFNNSSAFNYRVREANNVPLFAKFGNMYEATEEEKERYKENTLRYQHNGETDPDAINPLGGNPGDFFDITTRPHPFSHFAVYPEELCEIPLKAGCPKEVCNKCGKPKEKIIESEGLPRDRTKGKLVNIGQQDGRSNISGHQLMEWKEEHPDKFLGYTDCGCNAGFSGGIVLDPFLGSGTTGIVALKQGKRFIGIELNPEYIKIANERLKPHLEQTKLI